MVCVFKDEIIENHLPNSFWTFHSDFIRPQRVAELPKKWDSFLLENVARTICHVWICLSKRPVSKWMVAAAGGIIFLGHVNLFTKKKTRFRKNQNFGKKLTVVNSTNFHDRDKNLYVMKMANDLKLHSPRLEEDVYPDPSLSGAFVVGGLDGVEATVLPPDFAHI